MLEVHLLIKVNYKCENLKTPRLFADRVFRLEYNSKRPVGPRDSDVILSTAAAILEVYYIAAAKRTGACKLYGVCNYTPVEIRGQRITARR